MAPTLDVAVLFSRSNASHQRKDLKREEFLQGMSYMENSTSGHTYGSLRTNLGVEKAVKLAFLFRQLNAE